MPTAPSCARPGSWASCSPGEPSRPAIRSPRSSRPVPRSPSNPSSGVSHRVEWVANDQSGQSFDHRRGVCDVIVLGVILLLLGLLLGVPILWTIGIVLVVVGLVLWLVGSAGHAVGGRRHYY